MSTELVPYRDGDDTFDAYVARPEVEPQRPRPAVVVIHAFRGRDAAAERAARRLAELGWVGAAVDLYGIGRRGTDLASSQALMMELLQRPEVLRRRLAASFDAVRADSGVDAERVGVIGYCFGGLCAILCARMGLALRGAVSFHGLLKIGEELSTRPRGRILVLHGQDDPMAPPADVGAFAEEMKRIDADWELHAYPGVVHSFTNPDAADRDRGTVYDAEADRRSWRAMTRFFEDVFA